jgi:hypothetical protein
VKKVESERERRAARLAGVSVDDHFHAFRFALALSDALSTPRLQTSSGGPCA